jgi:crotonobetainyl-CoA:carnitine CoA-transferase CaiB-like acyl-CoA transferase
MVPAVGRILADWGAEVIKIEHPLHGDPVRGLTSSTQLTPEKPVNYVFHHANRGKLSMAIDLIKDQGRELVYRLAETSDVFLTSFLPAVRERLRVDVEHIRSRNPDIIYARGSGVGPRGPERDKGGYDYAAFWCRAGLASTYHHPDLDYPPAQNGGFGDLMSAAVLAGGIATALFRREYRRSSTRPCLLWARGRWPSTWPPPPRAITCPPW